MKITEFEKGKKYRRPSWVNFSYIEIERNGYINDNSVMTEDLHIYDLRADDWEEFNENRR